MRTRHSSSHRDSLFLLASCGSTAGRDLCVKVRTSQTAQWTKAKQSMRARCRVELRKRWVEAVEWKQGSASASPSDKIDTGGSRAEVTQAPNTTRRATA